MQRRIINDQWFDDKMQTLSSNKLIKVCTARRVMGVKLGVNQMKMQSRMKGLRPSKIAV